ITETVRRVDYRKGPSRADTGAFSFAGASSITTRDRLEPFALAEVGMYDSRRFVAGGSAKVGSGNLLVAGQAKFYNGPWDLPEDYAGYSGLVQYSAPLGDGTVPASLNLVAATSAPPEQH